MEPIDENDDLEEYETWQDFSNTTAKEMQEAIDDALKNMADSLIIGGTRDNISVDDIKKLYDTTLIGTTTTINVGNDVGDAFVMENKVDLVVKIPTMRIHIDWFNGMYLTAKNSSEDVFRIHVQYVVGVLFLNVVNVRTGVIFESFSGGTNIERHYKPFWLQRNDKIKSKASKIIYEVTEVKYEVDSEEYVFFFIDKQGKSCYILLQRFKALYELIDY